MWIWNIEFEDKTLKFIVNGVKNDSYDKYVLNQGDRIALSYGNET